ncbi:hypothetical protein ANN_12850 [Periplaneta americana]|uniref:PiggyBac transposable element-derived protein domain-containing protein n=1 Tax=Periplaneta americana TaxID=6978 RepID=A0ABQ8TIA7_PERAM|nr:hypothetical protein ANN_12850 [Periplaneta americana]
MDVYAGKSNDPQIQGGSKEIVKRLVKPIEKSGRKVTIDRFYTYVDLSETLWTEFHLTLVVVNTYTVFTLNFPTWKEKVPNRRRVFLSNLGLKMIKPFVEKRSRSLYGLQKPIVLAMESITERKLSCTIEVPSTSLEPGKHLPHLLQGSYVEVHRHKRDHRYQVLLLFFTYVFFFNPYSRHRHKAFIHVLSELNKTRISSVMAVAQSWFFTLLNVADTQAAQPVDKKINTDEGFQKHDFPSKLELCPPLWSRGSVFAPEPIGPGFDSLRRVAWVKLFGSFSLTLMDEYQETLSGINNCDYSRLLDVPDFGNDQSRRLETLTSSLYVNDEMNRTLSCGFSALRALSSSSSGGGGGGGGGGGSSSMGTFILL